MLGNTYTDVIRCDSSTNSPRTEEFNLGTDTQSFNGFIGVDDTSSAGTTARATLLVDGNKVFEQDIVLGDQIPIDLDITNALRMKIEVRELSGSGTVRAILTGELS